MRAVVLIFLFLIGTPAFGQQSKEIINSIGMKMVLILPGSFLMGPPTNEVGSQVSLPLVTISNWYYLGTYEVTQDEYQKVIGRNPSRFIGGKNPVECVSWEDAVSFCRNLSELPQEKAAGREYRLPTESEWEYSCRATSGDAYSFGDTADLLGEFSWFDRNATRQTHEVGEKKANRWGLYDMHGNVCEWCQDWYDFYPSTKETDPTGPISGSFRVRRGGSWSHQAKFCEAAYRYAGEPTNRSWVCGFRVALTLPTKQRETVSRK